MPKIDVNPGATLARFASDLRFDDIPAAVVQRAEDLLLDWIGSALAIAQARGSTGRDPATAQEAA